MKKLLLILIVLAGMAISQPAQGMERIKALFSLDTCYINKQKISDSDDFCAICKENYLDSTLVEINNSKEMPKRSFLGCHPSHHFHRACIIPWAAQNQNPTCPTCRALVNRDNFKYMFQVSTIKTAKCVTLALSSLCAALPFMVAEKILGQEWLVKYNLSRHNTLGSLLHSYVTLLLSKKVDTLIIFPNRDVYPITCANAKNTLILSAAKLLANTTLDKIDLLDRGPLSNARNSVLGGSCFSAYFYIMPWLLEHKSI